MLNDVRLCSRVPGVLPTYLMYIYRESTSSHRATRRGRRHCRCVLSLNSIIEPNEPILDKRSQLFLAHGTADKVTSCKASETFFNSVVADDKKLSLYDVRPVCPFSQNLTIRMS